MPLSDWRDADYGGGNPDGFNQPYTLAALRDQVVSGEGYDWYYASAAAREARARSPISDGAYGKPWVFRPKDIRSWWETQHFDRPGGIESPIPTAWVPRSKPVWFTELGCPAVDKGANQPNAFPDALSSEGGLPYFSSGGRSDLAQQQFLRAHFLHWLPDSPGFDPEGNPWSAAYGDRMLPASRIHLWAWDARPFPAYPRRSDLWQDSDNWQRGHWLNGRAATISTADLIRAVLADHGLTDVDVSEIGGSLTGYLIDSPTTARGALETLVDLYGIAVREDEGRLVFRDQLAVAGDPIRLDETVIPEDGPALEYRRAPEGALPVAAELAFVDLFRDHQASVVRRTRPGAPRGGSTAIALAGSLEGGAAEALLADWLERRWTARETIAFSLPPASLSVSPGALVSLADDDQREYIVTDVEVGLARRVTAHRVARAAPSPWRSGQIVGRVSAPSIAGVPHAVLLDLPAMPTTPREQGNLRLAAYARPWTSQVLYASAESSGFTQVATVNIPATMGELIGSAEPGPWGRIDHHGALTVALYNGSLSSVSDLQLLNGANMAAIRADNGAWEVIQFRDAEEVAPSVWEVATLLRGQYGTEDAMMAGAAAGASFVLLDTAVAQVELAAEFSGMPVNWRVGPSGQDFGSQTFRRFTQTGGVRSRLPLAPVHLRLSRQADGGAMLSWIRRGRIEADSWLAEDIPLGEEFERYRIEIGIEGGSPARTVESGVPEWTYSPEMISADFPALPAQIAVTVRQIGAGVGAGLPARATFLLD
jgi:hypothetical protein